MSSSGGVRPTTQSNGVITIHWIETIHETLQICRQDAHTDSHLHWLLLMLLVPLKAPESAVIVWNIASVHPVCHASRLPQVPERMPAREHGGHHLTPARAGQDGFHLRRISHNSFL